MATIVDAARSSVKRVIIRDDVWWVGWVSAGLNCPHCLQSIGLDDEAVQIRPDDHQMGQLLHLACADAYLDAFEARYNRWREVRDNGMVVEVVFDWDADCIAVPSFSFNPPETRIVPADLPSLPDETIIRDLFHRPLARAALYMPRDSFEAWWAAAAAREGVNYQLFAYEGGSDTPTRQFIGSDLSKARARAILKEMEASRGDE